MTVDKNEPIIIGDRNYVYQLGAVLQKTPKRTIANYFAWHAVSGSSRFLNDVLLKRGEQYVFDITGKQKSKSRLIYCVERTQISYADLNLYQTTNGWMKDDNKKCVFFAIFRLPIAVAANYIRKYFNEDLKNSVNTIAQSIHKEFIRMLKNTPWMDAVTRNAAIEKALAMNFFIGCPNELTDNAKLDEYYQSLELQPDSLLHSMLHIRKFNKNSEISEFRQPIEKGDWRTLSSEATMVNAFYSPQLNIISKLQEFKLIVGMKI